jgi:ABC-2 type transport system ATP-binding protein
MSDYAMETRGLVKVYPQARALDGLEAHVPRGAIYGLLGRNGAGKTTTIKILLGLARATAGEARVLGFDVRRDTMEILRRTAFVGENKPLYLDFTGAEHLRFARGFYPGWSDEAAQRYAARLELDLRRKVSKLSRGNRTKVSLVTALAQRAELLILDEPTSGLDPVAIDEFLRILVEDHAAEGRSVLFSSHHLAEVEQVAEWVGVVDGGRLLLEARLDDIRNEFRLITAGGRDLTAVRAPEIVSAAHNGQFSKFVVSRGAPAFTAALEQQGATVLSAEPMGLRDVFLHLVRKEEQCVQ